MSNVKSFWGCRSLRWRIRRYANKCDLRIRFSATTGQFRDGFDTIHVLSVVDIKVYRLVLAHECWPKKRCIYLQYGAYLDPETTSNRLSVVFYIRYMWHLSNIKKSWRCTCIRRGNLKSAKKSAKNSGKNQNAFFAAAKCHFFIYDSTDVFTIADIVV